MRLRQRIGNRRFPAARPAETHTRRTVVEACGWFDEDEEEWVCEYLGTGKWRANLGLTTSAAPAHRHRRPLW